MSLNNWLCKTFDKDKKGYVTIKDIVPINFIITRICQLSLVLFLQYK